MSLPDFAWQLVYGRLAWAVVAAAVLASLWPAAKLQPRRTWGILAGMVALMSLPGQLSPAYWLGMAFQYPSALLSGCCALALKGRIAGHAARRVVPPGLMAALAAAGAFLYADAAGLLSLGVYQLGFGAVAVPALALLGTALCALVITRGRGGNTPVLMLVALLAFTLLRLPTGNAWDALIDPLLWIYCVACLASMGVRTLLRAYRQRSQPAPAGPISPELPVLEPVVAELYLDDEGAPSVNP